MTTWERYDEARDFTREGREGKGDVLTLESACACLSPAYYFDRGDCKGEVSDLAPRAGCVVCEHASGKLPPAAWRRAADVLAFAKLPALTPQQLHTLRTLERLTGYGLRWTDPAAKGGRDT